ncbi:MAG: hypothetical protein NTZ20_03820 [Candidatus Levybacteria bacterium]|nr:hypothetical protein [Candidatus Levybacteria bacterium]
MKLLSLKIPGIDGSDLLITPPVGIPGGGNANISSIINTAISLLFFVGVFLTIVMILISGIQWIMSGGDKGKIESARNRLTYSIIGFLLVISSFAIIKLIISTLGGKTSFFGGL